MVPHLQARHTVLGPGQGHDLGGEADGRDVSQVPSTTQLLHSPPAPAQRRPTLETPSDFPLLWDRDLPRPLQTVLAPHSPLQRAVFPPTLLDLEALGSGILLALTVLSLKLTTRHV